MNEWEIKYVYNGNHISYIEADTLERAIEKWRLADGRNVPGIALYSVICVK